MKSAGRNSILILFLIHLSGLTAVHAQMHLDTVRMESIDIRVSRQIDRFDGSSAPDSVYAEAYRSKNIGELLSTQPGVQLMSFGQGNTSMVSFRGTGSSHTLVSWNGISLNSPLTGQFDFSLIPSFFIENIRIAPGNSSVESGSGGLGGSVDLSNSFSGNLPVNFRFMREQGSFGLTKTAVGYANTSSALKYRIRYQFDQSDNDFEFENRIPEKVIMRQKNAESAQHAVLFELSRRIASTSQISFRQFMNRYDRNLPPLSLNYENSEHRENLSGNLLSGVLTLDHFGKTFSFRVQSTWRSEINRYLLEKEISGGGLIKSFDSYNRARSFFQQFEISKDFSKVVSMKIKAETVDHRVQLNDKVLNLSNRPQRTETNISTSFIVTPAHWISFHSLLRKQFVKGMIVPVTWSLKAELTGINGWNFFMSWAKNYKIPSMNDLYFVPGGNPALLPENGKTIDAGIEKHIQLKNTQIDGHLTVYTSNISNWVLWTDSGFGYWTPENLQQVNTKGAECQINASSTFKHGLRIKSSLSYTYTSSLYTGSEPAFEGMKNKQLLYVPLHSVNGTFYLTFRATTLLIDNQTTGERPVSYGAVRASLPWYSIWNLQLTNAFSYGQEKGKLTLGIQNLTDEQYNIFRYRPMPGRNYFIKLEIDI